MQVTIYRLVVLSIVAALAGVGFVLFWTDASGPDEKLEAVLDVVRLAFGVGVWGWLGRVTVVAAGVASVLTVTDWIVNRTRKSTRRPFSEFPKTNIRGHVQEVGRRVDSVLEGDKGDVIAAFDELVRGAISIQASDIHMSPTPEGFRLTYRVHGILYEITNASLEMAPRLVTRVKVLARLDTYVRGTPQDGRLVMPIEGTIVEARVSTLPTESGERVVLRFVRGALQVPEIETLGFSDIVQDGIRDLLSRPQGLMFLSAPVGSGKTTTLYAAMKHIADSRGRTTTLVTLEDPIELELPFATQTQMHPKAGMTFASTLRSVLRQDPNVLMVGEIRDHETADIAMQAGLTGHLILTTVHGDSAAGPFARIVDMNVEPFILASATIGSLSQRLVRTLCMNCRKEAAAEPMIVDRLSRHDLRLPAGRFYEPVGCDFCEGHGFTGRRPIAELLVVDATLRAAVNERCPTKELHAIAVKQGMVPLLEDGLRLAATGETSLTEVLRVAG